MHPFDAAPSFLPVPATPTPRPQQQQEELVGAAASSPSPSRGTRAGGGSAGVRCQQAHCCSDPGHVKTTPHHVPASQCSERQQTVDDDDVELEPIPKRPRRTALPLPPSVAAAPTTTSSGVDQDQPIATTTVKMERFAREVSLDAVFRRVRLGGGGPGPPEVAYYTTVTIAGHVFRGVLYDVGGPRGGSGGSTTGTAASDTDGSGDVGSSLSTAGSGGGGGCQLDLTLGL